MTVMTVRYKQTMKHIQRSKQLYILDSSLFYISYVRCAMLWSESSFCGLRLVWDGTCVYVYVCVCVGRIMK